MPRPSRRVRSWLRLTAAFTMCAGLAGTPVPAAPASAQEAPSVFAGRVEGTAIRYGIGALSTFLDPGSAYTFASISSSASATGEQELRMKATGANLDPGTLTAAVIWAPTSPLPAGLNGAAGFPFYSEAFHPPAADQSSDTQKCAVNKEAQPSEVCQTGDMAMYSSAVVEPEAELQKAEGFARSAGTQQGDLTVGDAEARALVTPTKEGHVTSQHSAEGRRIAVGDTGILVNFSVRSEAVATPEGVTGQAACDVVFNIGGQELTRREDIDAALRGVSASSGGAFQYTPPAKPRVEPTPAGGIQAACDGARLAYRNQERGIRLEYLFGSTMAIVAPLGKTLEAPTGGGLDLGGEGGAIVGGEPGPPSGGAPTADTSLGTSSAVEPSSESGAATPSGGGEGGGGDDLAGPSYRQKDAKAGLVEKRVNAVPVGFASGGAAAALLLVGWLLIGVVRSLARGGPLRLPGL